jgi:putative tryptophan/tyrosine transport system substrate-binding protein
MKFAQLKRREVIILLGGAAAWPLSARAQQRSMPTIGFLNGTSVQGYGQFLEAFRHGLNEVGYVEGQNVAIEYRWAEGHYERLPALAADLVRRGVNLIAATSTPANLIAKQATTTVPVVFTTSSDPVELGLVASLSHPGGNVTGAVTLNIEVGSKRLELLRTMVPSASVIGVLINPSRPGAADQARVFEEDARVLGLQVQVLGAGTEGEIEAAFTRLGAEHAKALLVNTDAFFFSRRAQLVDLASRYAIPAIFDRREYAKAGGPHELWGKRHGRLPLGRQLRRPDSQRRGTCGFAGAAVHQNRIGHQPEGRKGARFDHSANAARDRG